MTKYFSDLLAYHNGGKDRIALVKAETETELEALIEDFKAARLEFITQVIKAGLPFDRFIAVVLAIDAVGRGNIDTSKAKEIHGDWKNIVSWGQVVIPFLEWREAREALEDKLDQIATGGQYKDEFTEDQIAKLSEITEYIYDRIVKLDG